MGRGASQKAGSAVKKANNKPGKVQNANVKQQKVTLQKDAASFLKQRLNQKVKNLRPPNGGEVDDDMEGVAVDEVSGCFSGATPSLETIQVNAARRGDEFAVCEVAENEEAALTNANREAENTRKKFYTELRKVLRSADVIVEVLDARDPGACRSQALEREVTNSGKRLILLVNKIDLVPREAVEAWIKHLQRSHPAIAFKACHGGAQRATHAMTSASGASDGLLRSTHAVVGAEDLMQLLKNYSRQQGTQMKGHISVGVVGYPNTGKSSVINSMKRHSAVETGGRAGVTKVAQEVQLDSKVTLIDSPGVVFEGSSNDPSVVLRNVVRVESVADPVAVVEALISKAPREALLNFYGLSDFKDVSDFLIHVAQVRGKLKKNAGGAGAGLDLASAARAVISDWTTGKFRYYVLPPASSSHDAAVAEAETAEVVTSLAPALDIDALFSGRGEDPSVLGAPREDEDAMCDDEGGIEVDVSGMRR